MRWGPEGRRSRKKVASGISREAREKREKKLVHISPRQATLRLSSARPDSVQGVLRKGRDIEKKTVI